MDSWESSKLYALVPCKFWIFFQVPLSRLNIIKKLFLVLAIEGRSFFIPCSRIRHLASFNKWSSERGTKCILLFLGSHAVGVRSLFYSPSLFIFFITSLLVTCLQLDAADWARSSTRQRRMSMSSLPLSSLFLLESSSLTFHGCKFFLAIFLHSFESEPIPSF